LLISPSLVAWMSPTILGLVLAIVLSWATAQLSFGMFLQRAGLLVTPEEQSKPAVVCRANELAKDLAKDDETADGLRHIYAEPEFRALHQAFLPVEAARKRGEIPVERALAEAKLNEAQMIDEAIQWLKPNERMAVLLDPLLIARLAALRNCDATPSAEPAAEN
jgi:membrane glycosyltransferase